MPWSSNANECNAANNAEILTGLFVNRQIGVRLIEEIDFDYMAVAATPAILTSAS